VLGVVLDVVLGVVSFLGVVFAGAESGESFFGVEVFFAASDSARESVR
jgi:hypothetical protein